MKINEFITIDEEWRYNPESDRFVRRKDGYEITKLVAKYYRPTRKMFGEEIGEERMTDQFLNSIVPTFEKEAKKYARELCSWCGRSEFSHDARICYEIRQEKERVAE